MLSYNHKKEIEQAIKAGKRASKALKKAQKKLDDASTWGFFDLIGGKTMSGLLKHGNLEGARNALRDARHELERFSNELDDIHGLSTPDLGIGAFATFADLFLDGFWSDLYVQAKIDDAKREVKRSRKQVKSVISELERQL